MKSFSQLNQDLWVLETLKNKKNGFFIDIGAYDGVYIDNTYILEKEYNWNGICIEANPIIFSELQNNRSCTCVNSILGNNEDTVYFEINQKFNKSQIYSKILSEEEYKNISDDSSNFIIQKKKELISNILKKNNAPKIIDYLSIDTNGCEYEILESFPFDEYKINCLTINHNGPHNQNINKNKIMNFLNNKSYKFVKGNDDIHNWNHDPIEDYYIYDDKNKNINRTNKKIGILIQKFQSLFNCGISQQSYFSYLVLKNAGYEVEFLSGDSDYTHFEYTDIPIRNLSFNSNYDDLDMVLFISSSISREEDLNFLKSFNVKIVNQICGNYYMISQEDCLHDCFKRTFFQNYHLIDEYWVLPMYDHMVSFVESITKKTVRVMNYVWNSFIIDKYASINNIKIHFNSKLKKNKDIYMLIAEPNLSVHKTALVPLCIAEKYNHTNDNLKKVYCLCQPRTETFKNFINLLDINKQDKLELHDRMILFEVLSQLREKNIPITLVSHQIFNELNFLHLELLHLGYPVLHNCHKIKEYGEYYHQHDINIGANMLKKLNESEYKTNDLWRFDPNNPTNINQYKNIIDKILGVKSDNLIAKSPEIITQNLGYIPIENIPIKTDNNESEKIENIIVSNSDKILQILLDPIIENTAYLRYELKNIIKKYNIKSILDCGCGDFIWMNKLSKILIKYMGIDTNKEIINKNKKLYDQDKFDFECHDITNTSISKYDLIICKDILNTFSYQNTFDFIKNVKKSKSKYILISTFGDSINKNISTGDNYNINLKLYPFKFPDPIFTINEKGTMAKNDNNNNSVPYYLCVYQVNQLPDFD